MPRTYELRRTQLVGAGGVGAIVDIGDESFVVCDTLEWRTPSEHVRLPRMEARLRRQLRKPPVDAPGSRGRVLLHRFPASMFCNHHECRRIIRWNEARHGDPERRPVCPACRREGTLVPMRFVLACEDGHLGDVPWHLWVHAGRRDGCNSADRLRVLVTGEGTGGLESLSIVCDACGARRSLEGITADGAMRAIGARCLGHHPWLFGDSDGRCDRPPVVLQRGATNLYYPWVASALSLGPDDTSFDVRDHVQAIPQDPYFQHLVERAQDSATTGNFVAPRVRQLAEFIANHHRVDVDAVLELVRLRASAVGSEGARPDDADDWDQDEVLREEWTFLVSNAAGRFTSHDLVCSETQAPRFPRGSPFGRVLLLHRLREVRAFLGFRRIRPGAQPVRPEAGRPFPPGVQPWVPAIEVFGEGIFIAFDPEWMARWETMVASNPDEAARIEELERVRREQNYWFLPPVTPRLIAVHTFAHVLMRQLVFESGYSSSALRERIYAAPDAAGVLIYTADSDSEGSLGGLVRQGHPDRLADVILLALDHAIWCSADPVCSETAGQGLGGFNRAACHACCLVPETSCVLANTLLDRGLLLGRAEGLPGLLGELV